MGCIVNGPGEMADADFGYVGSGPGTVNLYVGKQLVERHLPQAQADDRLVALIREHGRWVEPGLNVARLRLAARGLAPACTAGLPCLPLKPGPARADASSRSRSSSGEVSAAARGFPMAMRPAGWRRLVLGAPAPKAAPPSLRANPGLRNPTSRTSSYGVEMNGRLVVEQSLQIEGEFRGELESAGSVFVAETGTVDAPIRARTVEIRGAVVGDVVASREVVIFATGRLHGDVETPSLVIARGATFNGRTRMYRPERSLQAPAASSAATVG